MQKAWHLRSYSSSSTNVPIGTASSVPPNGRITSSGSSGVEDCTPGGALQSVMEVIISTGASVASVEGNRFLTPCDSVGNDDDGDNDDKDDDDGDNDDKDDDDGDDDDKDDDVVSMFVGNDKSVVPPSWYDSSVDDVDLLVLSLLLLLCS